jgi:hypothetical protein
MSELEQVLLAIAFFPIFCGLFGAACRLWEEAACNLIMWERGWGKHGVLRKRRRH